ncbi:hypothetical protein AVEN_216014-1 [Araneus ventricosus]|uniref:Uncharacterized protein n=1 Tax=Araneus ventricosus TaxID=182803 RepID=A0A4Y2RZQ7_ARAVE|nr:hypothetical protein AVEN_216014-1 [Araneus ventricosus]
MGKILGIQPLADQAVGKDATASNSLSPCQLFLSGNVVSWSMVLVRAVPGAAFVLYNLILAKEHSYRQFLTIKIELQKEKTKALVSHLSQKNPPFTHTRKCKSAPSSRGQSNKKITGGVRPRLKRYPVQWPQGGCNGMAALILERHINVWKDPKEVDRTQYSSTDGL